MNNSTMSDKLCLVTGANSGIGKATATELAARGAYIVMLCRNEEKAKAARDDIIEATGNTAVKILLADLSIQYEIREATGQLLGKFDSLDLLINNAGTITSKRTLTVDGIEKTLAVNHLGPFLLTNLLLDALQAAPAARVINVASEAHRTAAHFFDMDNLQLEKNFSPMKAYGLSKLCNIMFTHELSRRTSGSSITTYALHPGAVRSNLTSEASWLMYLLFTIGKPFMKTPSGGAQTPVYLATADEAADKSGKYFKNKKQVKPADLAYQDNLTEALWEKSEKLVGLR